jgi:aquaporin Z
MERHGADDHVMVEATGGVHVVEWACELAGTALLLLAGLSAVALDFGDGSPVAAAIPSMSLRLLLTGALFAAAGSLIAVSPLGRRSGGHINPAVTFAFWVTRHVHPHDLAGYVGAQLAGAVLGVVLWRVLWGPVADSVMRGVTAPGPGVSPPVAVLIEALMTAFLIAVIFAMLTSRRTLRWTPLAVWAVVTLLVWQAAPLTGTSLNPARSLAPALLGGGLGVLWVYVAGPLIGALAVAVVWRLVGRRPLTAKLFHDPRYRCVLAAIREDILTP